VFITRGLAVELHLTTVRKRVRAAPSAHGGARNRSELIDTAPPGYWHLRTLNALRILLLHRIRVGEDGYDLATSEELKPSTFMTSASLWHADCEENVPTASQCPGFPKEATPLTEICGTIRYENNRIIARAYFNFAFITNTLLRSFELKRH
jgi:hypothetical protein